MYLRKPYRPSRRAVKVTLRDRALFDRIFRQVMRTLPAPAREQLKLIAVAVDDIPSPEAADGGELFGLYTGIPLLERSTGDAGVPDDIIHVYRLALLRDARNRSGRIDQRRLRKQVRTTLLHELGHYHGFDEDALERLGYS